MNYNVKQWRLRADKTWTDWRAQPDYGTARTFTVPKGTRCVPYEGDGGLFFVAEYGWTDDDILRNDATVYGLRVKLEEVELA